MVILLLLLVAEFFGTLPNIIPNDLHVKLKRENMIHQ